MNDREGFERLAQFGRGVPLRSSICPHPTIAPLLKPQHAVSVQHPYGKALACDPDDFSEREREVVDEAQCRNRANAIKRVVGKGQFSGVSLNIR